MRLTSGHIGTWVQVRTSAGVGAASPLRGLLGYIEHNLHDPALGPVSIHIRRHLQAVEPDREGTQFAYWLRTLRQ